MRKRGVGSPDRAEALMLAFADRRAGVSGLRAGEGRRARGARQGSVIARAKEGPFDARRVPANAASDAGRRRSMGFGRARDSRQPRVFEHLREMQARDQRHGETDRQQSLAPRVFR